MHMTVKYLPEYSCLIKRQYGFSSSCGEFLARRFSRSKSRRVWEACKWLWCALFVITSIFKPAMGKKSFTSSCEMQFQRSITISRENVIIQGIQRNDMIWLIPLRLNSFFFSVFLSPSLTYKQTIFSWTLSSSRDISTKDSPLGVQRKYYLNEVTWNVKWKS